ncbi:alpha,alpha-trehalose-phosphate synthase (UDP-forming) [Rhodoligotrophos defluvii]|uniref:alpha,alpha-trehalose-phosphate synthase (UDP-forming) n=1 Tax=Rhodoligotrophos defluvii TaxID=2561934 RepID=UPI0010C9D4AB|nr:trehalose-6-phosphate synthase [Rhodoligotrophos defluvii]
MPRLIVVSNRVARFGQNEANTGGLATALKSALEDQGGIWFGWSGDTVDGEPGPPRREVHGPIIRATVDLQRNEFQRFYTGFSNGALWPLLHYRTDLMDFHQADYEAYQRVNERFAVELMRLLRPDDVIWVHDYQLFPLGSHLRAMGAHHRIGFFLHTPFPPWQIISALPVHSDIAEALAAYDLIGTQTDDDAQCMREFLRRVLQLNFMGEESRAGKTRLRVTAFPISIDARKIAADAARAAGMLQTQSLLKSLDGRALVISVDRLDYTKGILQRIAAIDHFLKRFPERLNDVSFLQIAPPTRDQIPAYRRLQKAVEEAIGRLNGQYAGLDGVPIKYLRKSFAQSTLFGFYRAANVGLVTPLRDGMNLVAKEYVACQDPRDPGVLVLSSMAGAAKELDAALLVNPHDPAATSCAIRQALDMSLSERIARHRALMDKLKQNDLDTWRANFTRALVSRSQEPAVPPFVPAASGAIAIAP